MMKDHDDYFFNPYQPAHRSGKGESMSSVRASFVFSFALLASVGAVLLYLDYADRFEMAPARQGLYIFDRKTTATNFCDTYRCIGISPEFILPKRVETIQIPGVPIVSQIHQPTPTIASLMMPQNQVPMPIPALQPQHLQQTPAAPQAQATPAPTASPKVQAAPQAQATPAPTASPKVQAAPAQDTNKYTIQEDEDMGGFIDAPEPPNLDA